ncbi:hypothetical protein WJX79_003478 [Trebouxia sp. C0005]
MVELRGCTNLDSVWYFCRIPIGLALDLWLQVPPTHGRDISQRPSLQKAFAGATVRQAAGQMRQSPKRLKAVYAWKSACDCLFAAALNLLHRDSL